jgi:glycopeptide antibiotics resistance protein
MTNIQKYRLLLAFWTLFVCYGTLRPLDRLVIESGIISYDAIIHFAFFGLLTFLAAGSFSTSLVFFTYSFSFALFTELLQLYVPGRNFAFDDLVMNVVGVGGGYFVFWKLKSIKKASR